MAVSTVSGSVGSSSGSDSTIDSAWGTNFLSITAIKLNGNNYPSWAKSVEANLLAKGQANYVNDAPPDKKTTPMLLGRKRMLSFVSRYRIVWSLRSVVVWSIWIRTKQVWHRAKGMFYGFGNLICTYDRLQAFFSFSLDDVPLEAFCGKFHNICEKIALSKPITSCYLVNLMPSTVLGGQIPHRVLFPDRPLYNSPPRVFGRTCYIHDLDPGRDKLDSRAIKCISSGIRGLRRGTSVTLLLSGGVDVTFNE